MKRPYKLILASMLCAAPFGALLPGCGGGGGSKTGPFRLESAHGIFFDNTSSGNLIFQIEDTASPTRKISGTIQFLNRSTTGANPTATSTATATATTDPSVTPTPTNVVEFYPAGGSYVIHGVLNKANTDFPELDAVGSLQGGPSFTLKGTVFTGQQIHLVAAFKAGNLLIEGRLLKDVIIAVPPTATPGPTSTSGATATPAATTGPTTAPTATATEVPTPTAGPTVTPSPSPTPTITPVPV